jgi:hypothetical protein
MPRSALRRAADLIGIAALAMHAAAPRGMCPPELRDSVVGYH